MRCQKTLVHESIRSCVSAADKCICNGWFATPKQKIPLILELLHLPYTEEACADGQWQKEELMERKKLEATPFPIGFWQWCLLVLPPLQL